MTERLNCKQIVHLYLKENGFDGLMCPGISCSCVLDDLIPCIDNYFEHCTPGYKVPCDPDDCENDGDCEWHIALEKPKKKPAKRSTCQGYDACLNAAVGKYESSDGAEVKSLCSSCAMSYMRDGWLFVVPKP